LPGIPLQRLAHEGISVFARPGLEIGDLAKCGIIDIYVVENDETKIGKRPYRAGNERWLSRDALCASGSTAKGHPCRISSIRVSPLPPIS